MDFLEQSDFNYFKMKKTFVVFLFALIWFSAFSQEKKEYDFYVGTFTSEGAEGIYLCNLDANNGEIKLVNTFPGVDNPSFLKVSPDKKYLYVASRVPQAIEPDGGTVLAYKILERGNIQFLNKQSSHGADPCHIDVSKDGKFVAIATYGGGTVSLYPVSPDGKLNPASTVIVNQGKSADPSRQSKPHAHSIKFSPFDNSVFSADLGTDHLDVFTLEKGELKKGNLEFLKLDPGSGPRHFDFHPDGNVIYVINELNSTITVFENQKAKWVKKQVIGTLPKNYPEASYCADIHVSRDGKFVYGSNRGHNSIAVFKVTSKTKKLENARFVDVEGNWPRNFALSPDGKFMLVANQKSGNITVFKIDQNSGMPVFTGKEIKIPSPVCIEFF